MFRLILMFIYCLSFGDAKPCQDATIGTSRSLYFSGIANQTLHGYGYRKLAGISAISCGNLCLSDTRCLSINYSEREKVCGLNGATASQHPEALTGMTGSYYGPEEPSVFCQLLMKKSGVGEFQSQTKPASDDRSLASDGCIEAGYHLCQPWELQTAFQAGYYHGSPADTSFWYAVPLALVSLNTSGITYQDLPGPIVPTDTFEVSNRLGMVESCAALEAHVCTLADLKEAFLRGYRQPLENDWMLFDESASSSTLVRLRNCGSPSASCYEGVVSISTGQATGRVFCCPDWRAVDALSLCCPGLVSLRDPIITTKKYAKEDREGMASGCSALRAHICTLAELKEAYVNGYRQPKGGWFYYSVPNREAEMYATGCGYHANECYEGIVANTPRPNDFSLVFCCPSTSALCSK